MASKSINCLLTGFDAFGEHQQNPSQILVEAFPDILKTKQTGKSGLAKEVHITKLVLPTAGKEGWRRLKKALDDLNSMPGPAFVLMTGLAAKRETLSLERFAMNIKDYRIADNSGEQPQDCPIDKKAPDLLRTQLSLVELKDKLSRQGIPAEVSNHAGTFICNELYFRALNYQLGSDGLLKAVLFVHLPEPAQFCKSMAAGKNKKASAQASLAGRSRKNQLQVMGQALAEIVESLALVL